MDKRIENVQLLKSRKSGGRRNREVVIEKLAIKAIKADRAQYFSTVFAHLPSKQ